MRAPLALAVLAALSVGAFAQRVQIPATTVAPAQAPAPEWGAQPLAPGYDVPSPDFNPYTGGQAVPVYGAPAYGAPAYGGTVGPPPASSLPYTYVPPTQPAAPMWGDQPLAPAYDPAAPPPSPGLYGEGSTLGWQPGTYGFQQNDGSTTKFRQFFARLRAEHTYLLGDNSGDAMSLNKTEVATTVAFPFFGDIDNPLLLSPGFAFNWFDGPVADPTAMPRGPDLPPRVYDAYLDVAWLPRWTPEFGAELGARVGVYSDFREVNEDSLRVLGRGLGVISVTPQFELLGGAVYLDRLRVKVLPAGGVRWRPSPEWDLYLVFPNPKVRRTWFSTGSADFWWYVAGEYGGGSWTAERAGFGDRFDYNDMRVVTGLEWQTPTQATGHLEIGYAFDREVRFESGAPGRAKLDDAVMFRAGVGF